jgi:hypothetical protein
LQFKDLHNYDLIEGEGFRNLVEAALFIGRRSYGDGSTGVAPHRGFDPVRNLIPSASQLKQVLKN